jgi:hypothetical protein
MLNKTSKIKKENTMSNLKEIFSMEENKKLTENGDLAFKSTTNHMVDLLFMSEYFSKHLDEVTLGNSEKEKLFAMFMRDPRFGMGRRDLGRKLMLLAECDNPDIVKAGRFDDLWAMYGPLAHVLDYLRSEIEQGNELAKKWMPRYSSKNLMLAREIARLWGMNKQQYGKFIKTNTTESKLSQHNENDIVFEHVPSLAMLKYFKAFSKKPETAERFHMYLESVKKGEAKLNVSTSNVYDIYKNCTEIDPDLFFSQLEKVQGNWLPIVDTSGSMMDENDSIGKAFAIGHYLGKTSTYLPNHVVSFSSRPQLIELGVTKTVVDGWCNPFRYITPEQEKSQYIREMKSIFTGDCSNTDFKAVMNLLMGLDKENVPEYLVVLSDMEFDHGSSMSKDRTMEYFKSIGAKTKIIWWNFNARATTCPEVDSYGNIFMSGYNPMLLRFLETGFDAQAFLDKLLDEYKKAIA